MLGDFKDTILAPEHVDKNSDWVLISTAVEDFKAFFLNWKRYILEPLPGFFLQGNLKLFLPTLLRPQRTSKTSSRV